MHKTQFEGPGLRYAEFVTWHTTIRSLPICERTYSDQLAITTIQNMQAIYDCKRESKIADAERKQDFQETVDGDISAADWIDHDLNDEADSKISCETTPMVMPDEALFFSFDLFSENSTIGASLAANVGEDYADSSAHFPVLFEVPRGALKHTHLVPLNYFHTLSLTSDIIRKQLEQLPKH